MTKLVIALDDLTKSKAKEIVEKMCRENSENMDRVLFKFHDLVALIGFEGLKEVISHPNARMMLDAKYNDIPYTVSNYLIQLERSGIAEKVELMTVHASAGFECLCTLMETKKRLGLHHLKIVAITCMTSLTSSDSFQLFGKSPRETVLTQAKLAYEAGVDAVVCSAEETPIIKAVFGDTLLIVNPGIRFDDDEKQDQKRVVNPKTAVSFGADYLVMGRSILKSSDMQKSITRALSEMDTGNYIPSCSYEFEKVLFNGTWQELLAYIGVIYTRKEGGKYCRFTSGLVSNMYINIGVLERYPSVLGRICMDLRKQLLSSGLFDETHCDDYVVVGAQMGSVRISGILSQTLGINGTSIYTEKSGESSYGMEFKRHAIDLKGKKVIISEDIISLGSTIGSMIALIKDAGGEVVAITCVGNRSRKETFQGYPIKYCFAPPEFELFWDDKTPESVRGEHPVLPAGARVAEKAKNEWNALVLSMRG